jgi:hypothetical protein
MLHGVLWNLFHTPFYPWQILALLPVCLAIAWVCQRTQSTLPGLVIHGVVNGLPALLAVMMALAGG